MIDSSFEVFLKGGVLWKISTRLCLGLFSLQKSQIRLNSHLPYQTVFILSPAVYLKGEKETHLNSGIQMGADHLACLCHVEQPQIPAKLTCMRFSQNWSCINC